jgi:NAD(P)-dependent dehydrogenase (short-subunit alcohol dehydrogenase family)
MSERRGRVEDKVAIVTGAGSTPGPGMATGRACAIVLAREGARLLADIDPERAEQPRALISGEGSQAAVFAGDMTRAADCDAMVQAAVGAFGTLDILVNNIGVAHAGNVADTSEAEWDRILRLSLKTMFLPRPPPQHPPSASASPSSRYPPAVVLGCLHHPNRQ